MYHLDAYISSESVDTVLTNDAREVFGILGKPESSFKRVDLCDGVAHFLDQNDKPVLSITEQTFEALVVFVKLGLLKGGL